MGLNFSKRFKRLLSAFNNIEPTSRSVYGKNAESYVQNMLFKLGYNVFYNKIIPHPTKHGRFLETDVILYKKCHIFCIEVKRFKGKIFFGRDNSTIVRENNNFYKRRYGDYSLDSFRNPLTQVQFFEKQLKKFLESRDRRFAQIKFKSIVAFSEEADITNLKSSDGRIMYISEIPEFIEKNIQNDGGNSYNWVQSDLNRLPTWDVIVNRNGHSIYGIIKDSSFKCVTDNSIYIMDYREIKSIIVKRKILSLYDNVEIIKYTGVKEHIKCIDGKITLDNFGKHQIYLLRNVNRIDIGIKKNHL